MTTATTAELLARRVAQLEEDRDRWERIARDERRASRMRGICVAWLMGNADDAHLKALALDDESLEIVANQCTDETFIELRSRGMTPTESDE